MTDFVSKFFGKIARSLSDFKINLTWGAFAGGERLNLNFRKLKESADSENQKSEQSTKRNLYLEKNQKSEKFVNPKLRSEKNSNSKKLEKNYLERNLKISESKSSRKFCLRFFSKILNKFDYFQQNLKKSHSGTILIEFAFCVPVLILLILYVHDIMIIVRTQDAMKRAAYCAVQLIQNVSKCRVDKLITQNDIKNIARAWMIMAPVAQKALKINNINIATEITLVKGVGNDSCKIMWGLTGFFRRTNNVDKWHYGAFDSSAKNFGAWGSNSLGPSVRGFYFKVNQAIDATIFIQRFTYKGRRN